MKTFICHAAALLFLTALSTHAQSAPVSMEKEDLSKHVIGFRTSIRTDISKLPRLFPGARPEAGTVTLEVIVSVNGRVNSAHAIAGPKEFWQQAEALEMQREFKPFVKNGSIVTAKIRDYVAILPEEEWLDPKVPFPAISDLSKVNISLKRDTCYGSCPAYTVTIHGDGRVDYVGNFAVFIPGHHTAHISADAVQQLVDAFKHADFFSAKEKYEGHWTDNPTQTITYSDGIHTKTVVDYIGSSVGMPDQIALLEKMIDDTAGVERWTRKNDRIIASLDGEHWDFGSSSQDNAALYRVAIESHNQALVERFLKAKAPYDEAGGAGHTVAPICMASSEGDEALVKRMAGERKTFSPAMLNQCLAYAARSDNLDLVNFWLDHGAHVVPDNSQYENALASAMLSKNIEIFRRILPMADVPGQKVRGEDILRFAIVWATKENRSEIVKALIQAGADVNARGSARKTPLFELTGDPELISVLVTAGADINARSYNDATPLMNAAYQLDYVRALLAAGADPTLKAKDGSDALSNAKRYNCPACVQEIEAAIRKWNSGTKTSSPETSAP